MKLFTDISRELRAYEKARESVIKVSRDYLTASKGIIFLCHENKLAEALQQLTLVTKNMIASERDLKKALLKAQKTFSLYEEGSWNAAVEEYLEAWFFVQFLKTGKLMVPKINPPAHVYLGALADFTGEVVRRSVLKGADKDVRTLEKYRKVIADVVAFMMPLYLTGQSRQKFDQAKRNLKSVEEILYEVKIRI